MKNYLNYPVFIILVFAVYLSFKSQLPNKVSKADAPKTEFSTERALVQLKEISKNQHYVGSNDHERVLNYIVGELKKLGLKVEIQEQVIYSKRYSIGLKIKNILARIKGKTNGKALLLLSHYDSAVSNSYGASDDGTGVVTILEGVRAFLAKNIQPENDIIILISDAEEVGLLGASAFVEHHPWAKDVGLVINFEARGTSGASYMLIETNGGNKQMIREFTKASPKIPVGNSMMYSIYKMMPNDTDLTVFREDGDIEGFNFAFIDDVFNYHMSGDNFENVSKKSLEHQGTYLTALLNYFSNTDLSKLKTDSDYVYFNFPVIGMVYYPFSWNFLMLIIAIILFVVLIVIGFKKGKLFWKGIGAGFKVFFILLITAPLITFLIWKVILLIHPQYNDILQGFTYNGYYYIAAFSALSVGFAFFIYQRFLRNQKVENLMVAPIFVWIIISLLTALNLKGAAFFMLPVYFSLVILYVFIFYNNTNTKIIVATLFSLPVLMLFSPFVQMLSVGLGLAMLALSSLLVVLIFGLTLPVVSLLKHNKLSSYIFFAVGIILLISASFLSGYNAERKKPDNLLYVADFDKNKAYWVSFDKNVDAWTKVKLGAHPKHGNFDKSKTIDRYFKKVKLYQETEFKNFLPAKINIVTDTIVNDQRKLKIIIEPQRKDHKIHLVTNKDIEFTDLSMNGLPIPPDTDKNTFLLKQKKGIVYYFSDKETLELDFQIAKDEDFELKIYEISFDLFENKFLNVQQRPDNMTPSLYTNDATVLIKTIKI